MQDRLDIDTEEDWHMVDINTEFLEIEVEEASEEGGVEEGEEEEEEGEEEGEED